MANRISRLIMVFELTDNLCEYPLEREEQILICITNLLIGYYEGNHLLMASELLCDHFQSKLSDSRAKSALNYLKNHCSFSFDVDWIMQVVINDDKNNLHEISIDFFEKTSSIQPVHILCENAQDVDFFINICKMYSQDTNINYIAYNGGGSDTAQNLRRLQNNNFLGLVIVDTDKRFPDDDFGETYKKVEKVSRRKVKHIFLHTLNFHEIENLLPFSFLIKITNSNGCDFLKKIASIGDVAKEILRFYDMKKGITLDAIQNDDSYYNFAAELYKRLYKSNIEGFTKHIDSLIRKRNNVVFPPIRQDAINKYLNDKNKYYPINYFEDEWHMLAKIILTFSCAREDLPIS